MKYIFILVIKAILLTLVIIIARGTDPRVKIDTLIVNSWKEFIQVFIISFCWMNCIFWFF